MSSFRIPTFRTLSWPLHLIWISLQFCFSHGTGFSHQLVMISSSLIRYNSFSFYGWLYYQPNLRINHFKSTLTATSRPSFPGIFVIFLFVVSSLGSFPIAVSPFLIWAVKEYWRDYHPIDLFHGWLAFFTTERK